MIQYSKMVAKIKKMTAWLFFMTFWLLGEVCLNIIDRMVNLSFWINVSIVLIAVLSLLIHVDEFLAIYYYNIISGSSDLISSLLRWIHCLIDFFNNSGFVLLLFSTILFLQAINDYIYAGIFMWIYIIL